MEQNLTGATMDQIDSLRVGSQVILQRHGKTVANELYEQIKDHSDFGEVSDWILNPELRDPKLCQTGTEQCLEAQRLVNPLKIHTVFVSPLRRALETAYRVYKSHPDFDNIRFIVLPGVRESLNTSSDVPADVESVISEFREIIPQLDSSLLDQLEDKKHYFIGDLQPEVRDRMISQLKVDEDDSLGSNAYDLFMKESKKAFPGRLESKWNVLDRSMKAKTYIKNYIRINQIPKDQKVVVLSHFIYFYMHTGKWTWKGDRDQELTYPSEFIRMKNGEIVSDPTDYSKIDL